MKVCAGKITIARWTGKDSYIEIEVENNDDKNTVVRVKLGLVEFAEALTGQGCTDCTITLPKEVCDKGCDVCNPACGGFKVAAGEEPVNNKHQMDRKLGPRGNCLKCGKNLDWSQWDKECTGKEPEEIICETCGFKNHCKQLTKDNNRNCANYVQAGQN